MLLDILFPNSCLGCGTLGSFVCLSCERRLRYVNNDYCLYCRKPSNLGLTHTLCRRSSPVDGYLTIFHYNSSMKKIIKNIKYRGIHSSFSELFHLLHQEGLDKFYRFKSQVPVASVQSIPLHPTKFRSRGFNQSDYIKIFFSSILAYDSVSMLERVKETRPQAMIPEKRHRKENLQNAFKLLSVKNVPSTVILIDDVVTTGSTVAEAARIVKVGGAARVYVFSLARG